jgi:hypothetical protein
VQNCGTQIFTKGVPLRGVAAHTSSAADRAGAREKETTIMTTTHDPQHHDTAAHCGMGARGRRRGHTRAAVGRCRDRAHADSCSSFDASCSPFPTISDEQLGGVTAADPGGPMGV